MKKQAKILLGKSLDSLTLAVELFNRPYDTGRTCSTLLLLQHSLEMLLKAAIVHKGGSIIDRDGENTIGFRACINRSADSIQMSFISRDQAAVLHSINMLRDPMQHYFVDVSEHVLYLQVLAGFTIFKDIFENVFGRKLATYLPLRVLPVSTTMPVDLVTVFTNETGEIRALLQPGKRKREEALARLRALEIIETAFSGEDATPTEYDLRKTARRIKGGESIGELFPNVAAVDTTTSGVAPLLELRMTKRDGIPVHYVSDEEGSMPMVRKPIADTEFYCYGPRKLAKILQLREYDVSALIHHLRIQEQPQAFKALPVYATPTKRYSDVAVRLIRDALQDLKILERAQSEYKSHMARGRSSK